MRLLNVHTVQFEKFDPGSIPKYVIASHRWSKGQEVSFEDFSHSTEKSGYRKITGFTEYVKTNVSGIDWLWIDTCCIDIRSSQEVSEAVNSMFRWYSQAEVCLAYLPDVHSLDVEDFIESEWFTRGWTLKELLAPGIVIFLSGDWQVIGHKGAEDTASKVSPLDPGRSLERAISSVTKIPVAILKDYRQSRAITVDEKLAWTSGRKTTREEDLSYCLFGIFDVAIPVMYGEGAEKARRRLMKEISESYRASDNALRDTPAASASSTGSARKETDDRQTQEILLRAMESLYFPQMEDRRDHIHVAYQDTYQWVLSPTTTDTKWDNLVTWLRDTNAASRIYWINAKPGAGKSSLARFLDEELEVERDMRPWADQKTVFRINYYFWSPGAVLQKSLVGLLRTIIYQLFEQSSERMFTCLPLRKRMEAKTARKASDISWTVLELREWLRKFVSASSSDARIFFLIDGLDEIDGDEDSRDELIEFLAGLTASRNIKICVSSRRWTVFEDAFARYPQLRLEDLNARDIETYVRGQLMAQPRYERILAYDPSAGYLVDDVIQKSQGVFLWTRLVVKELTRGIRDGDNYLALRSKMDNMPDNLNAYFARLIDSIEPYHRREACVLLQIALHDEREFTTLHPLRLLDLIFIQDADHDFGLSGQNALYIRGFNDAEELLYRLDSTLRRLSSLCKGLLECFFHGGSSLDDFVIEGEVTGISLAARWQSETWDESRPSPRTISSLPRTLLPVLEQHKYTAFDFQIDFMHRSLRDYLLQPEVLQFLHQHTGGPFDARNYLRNARLVEIAMASSADLKPGLSLGLASYYISTLSVPGFRTDPRCAQHVTTFRPLTAHYQDFGASEAASFWYICHSIRSWFRETSNFESLAIDFALTGYLAQNLTADMVRRKTGRPLLDYALRPRFADFFPFGDVSIGLQYPDPDISRILLSLGANPNQPVEGVPIWPLFLSFIAEQGVLHASYDSFPTTLHISWANVERARRGYFLSLQAMIQAGASKALRWSDLSAHVMHGMFAVTGRDQTNNFRRRWNGVSPIAHGDDESSGVYATTDILACLRPVFGDHIGVLQSMMETRPVAPRGL